MIEQVKSIVPSLCSVNSRPLSEKMNLPSCQALYLVIEKDRVIYVGSTVNLKRRFKSHHRRHQFASFNTLVWFDFSMLGEDVLREVEQSVIALVSPQLNNSSTGRLMSESQKEAQKRYVERNPEKIREIQRRADAKRNRAEYLREWRLRRKLLGRPVPSGNDYRKRQGESLEE